MQNFRIQLCLSEFRYVLLYCIMLFSIGLCSSTLYYALLYWILFFYIALCEIKLCLLLQSCNSVPVCCVMVFCFVLSYSEVNYAYVISFMALTEQNLDD